MVENLQQQRIMRWHQNIGGLSMTHQLGKLREENWEITSLLLQHPNPKLINGLPDSNLQLAERLALELTDVAIVAIGINGLLRFDFDRTFEEKMRINETKYNADDMRRLRAEGYGAKEAMQILKEAWI